MKSKIILFALSATLLLTGCKVQTAQQYENEQEEEAKKVVVLNDEEQKKAKEKEETKETAQDDKGSVTKEVAATSENDTTTSTNSSVSTVEKSTSTPSQTQKPEAKKETTTSNNTSKEQPTKTEKPVKKDEPKKETTVTKKPETTTSIPKPSTPKPSTPKPSTPEKPVEKPAKKEYATITIGMRTLLNPDHYELLPKNLQSEKYVPASGVLLNNAKIEVKEGDTAWDAISKLRSKYGIYINYEKNPMYGIYIIGINHINEKQAGSLSGWMYTVNGVKAPVGVGNYELEEGDRIELQYTTNGGTDLGW